MREHMGLYRGKRIDNGEWVEGSLLTLPDGRCFIVNNIFGACIDAEGNFINTEAPFVCEVDPDTVGECTGLRDKNGKLIFEGDILQREGCGKNSVVHTAKYHEIYGMWYVGSRLRGQESMSLLALTRVLYEIIGNIHDNPEQGFEGLL